MSYDLVVFTIFLVFGAIFKNVNGQEVEALPLKAGFSLVLSVRENDGDCVPSSTAVDQLRDLIASFSANNMELVETFVLFDNFNIGFRDFSQEISEILLDLNGKLFFHCLKPYSEGSYSCNRQIPTEATASTLFTSLCSPLDYKFVAYEALADEVFIQPILESEQRKPVTLKDVPEENYHQDESCQLWWPLNNTDLLLYNYVPSHLSPIRVKQKFIVKCQVPRFPQSQLNSIILKINEHMDDQGYEKQQQWFQFNVKEAISANALLLEANGVISFTSFEIPGKKKKLEVIIESPTHKLYSRFSISLKVNYLVEHLNHPHSIVSLTSVEERQRIQWLSSVESRDDLGFLFSALFHGRNDTIFLEIGVNKANYAEIILNTWSTLSVYIGVDSWKPFPHNDYVDDANLRSIWDHEKNYQETMTKLSSIPTQTQKLLIRLESRQVVRLFLDESIDVVYLDAMHHYRAVYEDILLWWPKIRRGGILAGHDYLLDIHGDTIFTVKPAVEKFARDNDLLLLQTVEREYPAFPTWFLIKPSES